MRSCEKLKQSICS